MSAVRPALLASVFATALLAHVGSPDVFFQGKAGPYPLLISIRIGEGENGASTDGRAQPVIVRLRTRIHPELGSGRPDEVVAALADELGSPLEAAETVRERLLLTDEPEL